MCRKVSEYASHLQGEGNPLSGKYIISPPQCLNSTQKGRNQPEFHACSRPGYLLGEFSKERTKLAGKWELSLLLLLRAHYMQMIIFISYSPSATRRRRRLRRRRRRCRSCSEMGVESTPFSCGDCEAEAHRVSS